MPCHCTRFAALTGIVLSCVFSVLCALPRRAFAYGEQAELHLAAGYLGAVNATPISSTGAALDLGFGIGLNDMFMTRAALGYGATLDNARVLSLGRAGVEVLYLVDVLQIVPFFGLGVGAWLFDDDALTVAPHAFGTVGLDYLATRTWLFGVDIRLGMLLFEDSLRATTQAQIRCSRTFDLF
jgi:hypothetical protein